MPIGSEGFAGARGTDLCMWTARTLLEMTSELTGDEYLEGAEGRST